MGDGIDSSDRVTYAEATEITGYTHRHLTKLAVEGALTREGGGRGRLAFFSRSQCEDLALGAHMHGHVPPPYWLTLTATSALLGISRQAGHQSLARDISPRNVPATVSG